MKKNLMFLALINNYQGASLLLEDGTNKVIKDLLDYDSMTRVFTVEFTDGDILEISDKYRYEVILPDVNLSNSIKRVANKKRKKFKKNGR